ncbi:MAG: hypothetical protein IJV69_05935, partial [Kiritimatiellae bacterium]|nr:hypothetical protein [Kiritimatiellia bacterium]
LFNAEGDVIGVIVSKLRDSQNVNYAIKGSVLLDFLKQHNIKYTKSTHTQTPTNIEDLVEIKEKSVFLIEATSSN